MEESTPPAGVASDDAIGPVLDVVADADGLLGLLAHRARLEQRTPRHREAVERLLQHLSAGETISMVSTVLGRWPRRRLAGAFDPTAASEAALAALTEHLEPNAASIAREPWELAVQVREELRQLGPEVEAVALRLLPSWKAPLSGLPIAAEGIASRPSGDVQAPDRLNGV